MFTVTETGRVSAGPLAALVGVKVTEWVAAPAFGTVAAAVNAKVPGTEAVPPVRTAEARLWP